MPITFRTYCETLQAIRETGNTNEKIDRFSDCLRQIKNINELKLAAQFVCEGAFEEISGQRASAGSRTSGLAAAKFCEIDYDQVFKPCSMAAGSSSEAIEKLMANIPAAVKKRSPRELSLSEIQKIFEKLGAKKTRSDKEKILHNAWRKMTPVEIKFFLRTLGNGSLLIGFETRSVVASIAKAYNKNFEDVHYAHTITGSVGQTAMLARQCRLNEAEFRLFHPVPFMMASPADSRPVENPDQYLAEEKFDGVRAQVHVSGISVQIFSHDMNDITRSFPEIISFYQNRKLPSAVLDGVICVYKNNTILPVQLLRKRMELKEPGKKIIQDYPVLFIAFDLLCIDGKPMFNYTLMERRTMLEKLSADYNLSVTNQFDISADGNINRLYERALQHGNEGLLLKQKTSRYEYGQRRKSWLKVKNPGGSLDTVIMYAHTENGNRGETYSGYTLGISVQEDERYEEEYIPIGKVYIGNPDNDNELQKLNKRINDLVVDRYGPTLGLLLQLVAEVEFDDIQVNKRTKAGYMLHMPRVKAIQWDLGPNDINTLKDVEKYNQNKLQQDRLPQLKNQSFTFFS